MQQSSYIKFLKSMGDYLSIEKTKHLLKLGGGLYENHKVFWNRILSTKKNSNDGNNNNNDNNDNNEENENKTENTETEKSTTNTSESSKNKVSQGNLTTLEKKDLTASIPIRQFYKIHNITTCPPDSADVTRDEAIYMYTKMQGIRRLENAASSLYREKIIRGFCHLYTGQEAVAVGMKSALRPVDSVITAYRCHGWCFVMGISPLGILSELSGRRTGVQRGKGGSMHMYTDRFFGGNGIVGAQVPLGTGIALASKYKDEGGVCVNCYGDGAANQGQVFESYNIACLWKLPVIFVCENNMYGMGTSSKRSSCNNAYFTRGDYVPGIWVDGMDIIAVRCATAFAIEYVLNNGPIIMEMNTYRYTGHSMSDPGTSYRTRDEIQEMRTKSDPIANFKDNIITYGLLTEDETKLIDDNVKKEIDEAVKVSKATPEIELSELTADVYAQNLETKIRGINDWNLRHIQINKGINNTDKVQKLKSN